MQDPGWGGSWRALIPGAASRGSDRPARSALSTLRFVFVAYVASVIVFGVVLFIIVPPNGDEASMSWVAVAIVAGIGLVALVAMRQFEPPLDCTDLTTLAATYRTRFFLRVGGADFAALAAFIAVFVVHSAVAYLPGLALALVGFRRAAPTARQLEADQEALNAAGCPRSLLSALTVVPD